MSMPCFKENRSSITPRARLTARGTEPPVRVSTVICTMTLLLLAVGLAASALTQLFAPS